MLTEEKDIEYIRRVRTLCLNFLREKGYKQEDISKAMAIFKRCKRCGKILFTFYFGKKKNKYYKEVIYDPKTDTVKRARFANWTDLCTECRADDLTERISDVLGENLEKIPQISFLFTRSANKYRLSFMNKHFSFRDKGEIRKYYREKIKRIALDGIRYHRFEESGNDETILRTLLKSYTRETLELRILLGIIRNNYRPGLKKNIKFNDFLIDIGYFCNQDPSELIQEYQESKYIRLSHDTFIIDKLNDSLRNNIQQIFIRRKKTYYEDYFTNGEIRWSSFIIDKLKKYFERLSFIAFYIDNDKNLIIKTNYCYIIINPADN